MKLEILFWDTDKDCLYRHTNTKKIKNRVKDTPKVDVIHIQLEIEISPALFQKRSVYPSGPQGSACSVSRRSFYSSCRKQTQSQN